MARKAPRANEAPLSGRQQEILRLIALGKSNKEIAHQLGLTTGTVKQHVYALFQKLGVRNRTTAVAKGAELESARAAAPAKEAAIAASKMPEDLRYARRLVTAVVIEPRPGASRSSRDAADTSRAIAALRQRVERLAYAFDAKPELLPAGGIAAWFGQPVAHGDDAERAVAFVRALLSAAREDLSFVAGIGTQAEVVGESDEGSIAFRTFRVASMLAGLARPDAPLACGLTAELSGLPPHAAEKAVLPEDAREIGPVPTPTLKVAQRWGGLPFLAELIGNLQRGRSQWLGVESWPPEAGTRLIDAIGECLAARGLPLRSLWMPAITSVDDTVASRLIGQLGGNGAGGNGATLGSALAGLAAAGPAVLLAYGIDALPTLKKVLGETELQRLRGLPLAVVAGAMHRSGAPQTVVRLLGSNPGASPFMRVLRMQVPDERPRSSQGIRPDVQAVLDGVSTEARAIARVAVNPDSSNVAAIARALAMAPDRVLERCRELESSGLLVLHEGRLQFRDATTADAVRASLA
jgi:DNA-binding CsgD family transcriptional regulator